MNEIVNLRTDALKPNSYNPNQMTDDEFAECLAEVRCSDGLAFPDTRRRRGARLRALHLHQLRCAVAGAD